MTNIFSQHLLMFVDVNKNVDVNSHNSQTITNNNDLFIYYCTKVRSEEGSRQGWLVETRVIYWLLNTKLNRCALCASYAHQLSRLSRISLSVFVLAVSLSTVCAPESPLRLSLCSPVLRWLLSGLSTPITAIRHRCSSFCT